MKANRVYAAARNTIRGNEIEDSASIVIEFENGITATYFISDGTPGPWNYELWLQKRIISSSGAQVRIVCVSSEQKVRLDSRTWISIITLMTIIMVGEKS